MLQHSPCVAVLNLATLSVSYKQPTPQAANAVPLLLGLEAPPPPPSQPPPPLLPPPPGVAAVVAAVKVLLQVAAQAWTPLVGRPERKHCRGVATR